MSPEYYRAGIAINTVNDIYIYLSDYNYSQPTNNITTSGAFQIETLGNESTISQFTASGDRVWTSYYGINSARINGIVVDASGLYVAGTKVDFPTSPNVPNTYFDTFDSYTFSYANIYDAFVSGLSLDGSTRLWSRYLGGSGAEFLGGMSSLALDGTGLYIAGYSGGSTNVNVTGIATPGAYMESKGCGDGFLAKLNRSGEIDWLTYTLDWVEGAYEDLGISCGENVHRIKSVFSGKSGVYYTGQTSVLLDLATEGTFMETPCMDKRMPLL